MRSRPASVDSSYVYFDPQNRAQRLRRRPLRTSNPPTNSAAASEAEPGSSSGTGKAAAIAEVAMSSTDAIKASKRGFVIRVFRSSESSSALAAPAVENEQAAHQQRGSERSRTRVQFRDGGKSRHRGGGNEQHRCDQSQEPWIRHTWLPIPGT